MNINNKTTKYIILAFAVFILAFGVFAVAPIHANAFSLGPVCLFDCKGSTKKIITNTYTNSNNVNSNINSPGAVIGTTPVEIAYVSSDYNYNYSHYPSLQVSCYPNSNSVRIGDTVYWTANVSGGNGSYYYTWSGTDGLYAYGSSVSENYSSLGNKSATVTVTSDGQTVSRACNGTVRVYDDNYNDYYPQPYYPPVNYYNPLSISCSPNTTSAPTGTSVRWNAYASGGNGYYTYSWSGTDNIYGSGQSIYYTYNNPGYKYATVTVYSDGQSRSASCNNTVNITGYVYGVYNSYNYNSNINSNSGLDAACFADPASARVNQPVTWKAEVVGGIAPYTYSWTGSNDLSGSDSSIIKYYSTSGEKSAIVTIKSADGRTSTRACSNSLTIRAAVTTERTTPTPPVVEPTPPSTPNESPLSAAALFSLKNVPWGLVAILIILVLFGTVLYLIFNRQKI